MANPTPADQRPSSSTAPQDPNAETPVGALGNLDTPEFLADLTLPVAPSPALPAGMILLSQWLADVPENELCVVLANYPQAVRTTIDALPLEGQTFTCNVIDPLSNQGKSQTRTLTEEVIRDSEEARTWLREQRAESRYHVMRHSGKAALTITEIANNPTTFDRMLAERRNFLELQHKSAATSASRPKKPVRPQPTGKGRTASKASGK